VITIKFPVGNSRDLLPGDTLDMGEHVGFIAYMTSDEARLWRLFTEIKQKAVNSAIDFVRDAQK
jgi:hypothetical protein